MDRFQMNRQELETYGEKVHNRMYKEERYTKIDWCLTAQQHKQVNWRLTVGLANKKHILSYQVVVNTNTEICRVVEVS